jgi:hypothetical protein
MRAKTPAILDAGLLVHGIELAITYDEPRFSE